MPHWRRWGSPLAKISGAARLRMKGQRPLPPRRPRPQPLLPPTPATPQPAEWESLPKSWKKDMDGEWKLMTPAQRQYVHEREKQQLEGLMSYKAKTDKWDKTLAPFQKFIAENKLDPYESVQRLGAVELILRQGTTHEKAQYLGEMIRFYGLEPVLRQMLGAQPAPGQPVQPTFQRDPAINQVQEELRLLKQWQQSQLESVTMEQVNAFITDPKNTFANELLEDMTRILNERRASDLPSAYEQAMWLNPDIRQKVLAEEVKKATTAPSSAPRLVRSSSGTKPTPTEQPKGTLDDMLRKTYDEIRSRSA